MEHNAKSKVSLNASANNTRSRRKGQTKLMTPQLKVDTSASSPSDGPEKAQALASNSNSQNHTPTTAETSATADSKSIGSSRSRGSAVLARAREYNRIIDGRRSRSNSRSKSNPRSVNGNNVGGGAMSQRERAMASLQNEKHSRGGVTSNGDHHHQHGRVVKQYRSSPTPSQKSSNRHHHGVGNHHNDSKINTSFGSASGSQRFTPQQSPANGNANSYSNGTPQTKSSSGRSLRGASGGTNQNSNKHTNGEPQEAMAIVTPELLVDALSGHEDGLLAIAERLMEHYDSGYDAMGEAIIDAFADVQKLFQHVVEAAHMEGAAYEAGRKEEEIERLKRALGGEGASGGMGINDYFNSPKHPHKNLQHDSNGGKNNAANNSNNNGGSPTSPLRHEEFIDQDVRDVLTDAIRKGQAPKEANKYAECYQIYENACNSASALLPVDSDHRGRLQLSIARAESMSPERACAILRYVMDDVLRSGLHSNSKVVMPDPSQRGDCVLTRPPPKMRGEDSSDRFKGGMGISADESNVLQSSEEALASLVEEMKEILSAPVYDQSPLQNVAERFWKALSEAERCNLKNEERLEQKLATLKAEYLLAREVSHNILAGLFGTP